MSSTLSLLLLPSSSPFSLLPPCLSSRPLSLFPRLHSSKPISPPVVLCKSSERKVEAETDLPENKKPLYAHSLGCIEAWLRQLGFRQRAEDPAAWVVEKGDWHAYLNLDVTDLSIRYLKTGPGNLEKDVERRFSYALSREDIENAILGGP